MANLVPLKGKNKPLPTADGSISLYSMDYNEGYRAKSVGAFTESLHKFYRASCIELLAYERDVKLLDICFGGGSNLAVTLDNIIKHDTGNRIHIVTVEKQASLFQTVLDSSYLWPAKGYEILRELIRNGSYGNITMDIAIGDARKLLKGMSDEFDVIYFDPFGKRKNPEMWTVEVFQQLHRLLVCGGRVATYSSGKQIRKDFVEAGFRYFATEKPEGAFQEGTLFIKD